MAATFGRWRLALWLLGLVGLGAAGLAAARLMHHQELPPKPFYAAAPLSAPSYSSPRGGCGASDGLPDRSIDTPVTGRLWVDPHPVGGVALWLPGMSSRRCLVVLTRLNTEQAEAFADAVEHAPPPPEGMFSCPNDDGSRVTVFLTYQQQREAEAVRILLSGCGGMSAPGRDGRQPVGVLAALGKPPKGMH